ncbi:hypothetical protein CAI21_18870 [Alkalilimnicola ehrlichii]|uniref:Uncharacterized protein n=1 Tax=Alkalilimnicola ehrlichii TaxID=351052 RepID=A0A3E0WL61_9GAMM|nr:hypothetical protein [Alkalilimnicola ehrlichii]RFA25587.1 hypothetical protein CAI21_18870 [Alkalilimnicola ehrlichii]RFA32716.1 hypothetical protein CAL65_19135 [Alkalilimnicola ehrlichii]
MAKVAVINKSKLDKLGYVDHAFRLSLWGMIFLFPLAMLISYIDDYLNLGGFASLTLSFALENALWAFGIFMVAWFLLVLTGSKRESDVLAFAAGSLLFVLIAAVNAMSVFS